MLEVARTAKSCSKVAEHNRERPIRTLILSLGCLWYVKFIQEPPRSAKRRLTEIPLAELDNYLFHNILEIKRKNDGERYEPGLLSSYRNLT